MENCNALSPMPNHKTLKPGDFVEWNPTKMLDYGGLDAYIKQTGVVVAVGRKLAVVRFADGAEHPLNTHHLTWLPTPEQIADTREEIDREDLERKLAE